VRSIATWLITLAVALQVGMACGVANASQLAFAVDCCADACPAPSGTAQLKCCLVTPGDAASPAAPARMDRTLDRNLLAASSAMLWSSSAAFMTMRRISALAPVSASPSIDILCSRQI